MKKFILIGKFNLKLSFTAFLWKARSYFNLRGNLSKRVQ